MGSEMCIRDSFVLLGRPACPRLGDDVRECCELLPLLQPEPLPFIREFFAYFNACLLYTSDAADERSSVDLGGRRIIKKKKKIEQGGRRHLSRV